MKQQFCALVLVVLVVLPESALFGGGSPQFRSALVGTWSGRVSSTGFASFAVTITVSRDLKAHLVGEASPCFGEADLVVTTKGPNYVTLAGSSKAGESITFKGTIDSSGKQLDLTYIANGSASARCETDQGAGTLDKQ
jgi:hypothetical protein